jgi:hypothetical protein
MPEVAQGGSAEAQEALRAKLTHVAQDFVQEVEVCCDSACAPPGHMPCLLYTRSHAPSAIGAIIADLPGPQRGAARLWPLLCTRTHELPACRTWELTGCPRCCS